MIYHYVYKITCINDGCFYIGCRSSKVLPERDVKYMGSGRWAKRKDLPRREKEIIALFFTRQDAAKYEGELIRNSVAQSKCMNRVGKLQITAKRKEEKKARDAALLKEEKKRNFFFAAYWTTTEKNKAKAEAASIVSALHGISYY